MDSNAASSRSAYAPNPNNRCGVFQNNAALGGIRKQHFHQFDQRAVSLPLRRAEQLDVDASGAEANGNSRQNLGSLGLIF